MLLSEARSAFLRSRQVAGYSERTVQFYEQQLRYFADTLPQNSDITKLDANTIEKYLAQRRTEVKPHSIYGAFKAISAFCNWLITRMPEWHNPIPQVTKPRLPKQHPKPVSKDVVAAMIETCSGRDFLDIRDKAILLVLSSSGLRAQELLSLRQQDVNLETGSVYVVKGKGGKSRITIISPDAREAVKRYLPYLNNDGPLWWGRRGPLTYAGLQAILRKRAKNASVPAPSAHDFRRRWASDMVPKLGPWVVQAMGGWSNMEIVRSYVTLSEEDLLKAYRDNV